MLVCGVQIRDGQKNGNHMYKQTQTKDMQTAV
jgi:hypothetical protein